MDDQGCIVLLSRNKDLEKKQAAEKKYGDQHQDTTQWLTGVERRVNQLPVTGKDLATVQKQLQEIKVCRITVVHWFFHWFTHVLSLRLSITYMCMYDDGDTSLGI